MFGQRTFGRQALTRFQRALEDHALKLLDNIVRQTALTNLIKPHNSITPRSDGSPGLYSGLSAPRQHLPLRIWSYQTDDLRSSHSTKVLGRQIDTPPTRLLP
ncbi:conserved hypothetical protein [Pseudomonas jessenii]